jgi:hypothetical protein
MKGLRAKRVKKLKEGTLIATVDIGLTTCLRGFCPMIGFYLSLNLDSRMIC